MNLLHLDVTLSDPKSGRTAVHGFDVNVDQLQHTDPDRKQLARDHVSQEMTKAVDRCYYDLTE